MPTPQQRRALHASQAAKYRRFADDDKARGLDHFAAVNMECADREQAIANRLSVELIAEHNSQVQYRRFLIVSDLYAGVG